MYAVSFALLSIAFFAIFTTVQSSGIVDCGLPASHLPFATWNIYNDQVSLGVDADGEWNLFYYLQLGGDVVLGPSLVPQITCLLYFTALNT